MALEFTKIGDVELLESVPDTANAVVEVDGAVKRVPGSNLGGGGVPTAIIRIDLEDEPAPSALASDGARSSAAVPTATCENMTFEEAAAILSSGQPLAAMGVALVDGVFACEQSPYTGLNSGIGAIIIRSDLLNTLFYWTASGISTNVPSYGVE